MSTPAEKLPGNSIDKYGLSTTLRFCLQSSHPDGIQLISFTLRGQNVTNSMPRALNNDYIRFFHDFININEYSDINIPHTCNWTGHPFNRLIIISRACPEVRMTCFHFVLMAFEEHTFEGHAQTAGEGAGVV